MIQGINSSGRYLVVTGGTAPSNYISPGSVGAGMMRYNPNMNCIEVNDGSMWKQLGMSYATVELSPDAESILEWARTQRTLEMNRKTLIKNNPALQKAYEAIQRAEANFDILSKFVENDKPTEQVGAWTTSMSIP